MSLNELKNYTPAKLYSKLVLPDEQFQKWLTELGLLHSKRTCLCGSEMRLEKRNKGNFGRWTCRNKSECRKTLGYLKGTFFENLSSPLTLKNIFELSYHWSRRNFHRIIYKEIQRIMCRQDGSTISLHTLCDWFNFFRDITVEHYKTNPIVLGGPNTIVEVDEAKVTKKKYGKGRKVKHKEWVVGCKQQLIVTFQNLFGVRNLLVIIVCIISGTKSVVITVIIVNVNNF